MDVLVVLEDNHGSLHRLSKEAIAGGQELGSWQPLQLERMLQQ